MRTILLFAAVAAVLSTAASADEDKSSKPDGEAAAAAEARDADPDREICKVTKTTGSRLGRQRICMTAAEWEKMRSENGRFLSERGKGSLPAGGGGR